MPSVAFNGSTDDFFLDNVAPPVYAEPMTIACAFNGSNSVTQTSGLYAAFRLGAPRVGGDGFYSLEMNNTFEDPQPDDPSIQIIAKKSVTVGRAGPTTTTSSAVAFSIYDETKWNLAAAVFNGDTSRTAIFGEFLSSAGITQGSDTTSVADPTGGAAVDQVIADLPSVAGGTGRFDGNIAWVAIWDINIKDNEMLAILAGTPPELIQGDNLLGYITLDGSNVVNPHMRGHNGTGWTFGVSATPAAGASGPPIGMQAVENNEIVGY